MKVSLEIEKNNYTVHVVHNDGKEIATYHMKRNDFGGAESQEDYDEWQLLRIGGGELVRALDDLDTAALTMMSALQEADE